MTARALWWCVNCGGYRVSRGEPPQHCRICGDPLVKKENQPE